MHLASIRSLAFAFVTLAVACSSSKTTSQPAGGAGTHVVAAQGGTVAAPGGGATLTIPAGALGADTDITLSVLPAANGSLSPIYDFGPDGTTFATPATLVIDADPSLAAAGSALVMVMLSGSSTVVELAGSTFQGLTVTAPVPHFTGFTVMQSGIAGDGGADPDAAVDADAGVDTDATVDNDAGADPDAADANDTSCHACFALACPVEVAACEGVTKCADSIGMFESCVGATHDVNGVQACEADFAVPVCQGVTNCTGRVLADCLLASTEACLLTCTAP